MDVKTISLKDLETAIVTVEEADEELGVVGRGRKVDRIWDALPDTYKTFTAADGEVSIAKYDYETEGFGGT